MNRRTISPISSRRTTISSIASADQQVLLCLDSTTQKQRDRGRSNSHSSVLRVTNNIETYIFPSGPGTANSNTAECTPSSSVVEDEAAHSKKGASLWFFDTPGDSKTSSEESSSTFNSGSSGNSRDDLTALPPTPVRSKVKITKSEGSLLSSRKVKVRASLLKG